MERVESLFEAVSVVGLLGMLQDGTGGTELEALIIGTKRLVQDFGGFVRHGLNLRFGDVEGPPHVGTAGRP